ncbi:DinB family protein [Lacisediminihabitans profunda]|uniref:DinB family protein n=1 Tax=Lacisediminihabitans profunda TaxID=2594790 RepID=A0A5C8URA3_9MICO|nr:DinB family protein [Lacisediminihabitans profunda]
MDEKATLHRYLRTQRENLLAKIDGLGEYDARRPLTPTGTNLLGLVKHVGSVQLGYFGLVFGRPAERQPAWMADDAPMDADMWASADESRDDIVDFYRYSAEHSDETIGLLPLDATGRVPWWPEERRDVTLHQILVHLCVEIARHAGHADILRELLDGSAGNGPADPNLPRRSAAEWAEYRSRLEAAALEAATAAGGSADRRSV